MTDETARETHRFQAEVDELLKLVIGSLYSNKEIFLRELLSNASDALDKLRFEALTRPELTEDGTPLEVRIVPDASAGTLTIEDTGIGMTHDELVKNLGTIAHSGSRAFLDRARAEKKDLSLIGQFGVGFYSAYLVADRVEVVSRAAGTREAFRWASDAHGSFTVEPASRPERGTSIVLHMKPEAKEYLEAFRVREVVRRYSDYVGHPIRLRETREKDGKQETTLDAINRASALWQRVPAEVTKEQYEEFYRHLTHDFEPPLAHSHFRIEGTFVFAGILFVPRKPPFDPFMEGKQKGIRLFVKRVFILEDCEEILPQYLRFVRGVVDSDDLPLNVSREILQDSAIVRTIKKQVVKKVLDRLDEMQAEAPDDYVTFWESFGAILKEGMAVDHDHRARIAKLARFRSTAGDGWVSLAEYVARKKEGQPAIYFAIGDSLDAVRTSPHLEGLARRGFEVLLLTDPVDEFAIDALGTFEDLPLVSAMRADLHLEPSEEEKARSEVARAESKALLEKIKEVLGDRVADVRTTERLTESACCLVVPEGGHHQAMEQLLRAAGRTVPERKRIFELNPGHPLVAHLRAAIERDASSPKIAEWIHTLYDQAVLAEGGRVEDPAGFARRITALLVHTASSS